MINELKAQIIENPLDILGFVFSLLYTLLASFNKRSCWYFAFIGSAMYVYLFFAAQFYLESILQVFYLIMAVVGWFSWKKISNQHVPMEVNEYGIKTHLVIVGVTLSLGVLLGFIFDNFTPQIYPYIDACIFSFSIVATLLTTKKIVSNWIYFVIIDAVAAPIYFSRELYFAALLFVIYVFLAAFAYIKWRQLYVSNRNHRS